MLKYKLAVIDTGFWKNTNNFLVAKSFSLYIENSLVILKKYFEEPKKEVWL